MKAVRTFIFWVYSDSRMAKLTKFSTDGPFSHMGIGFELTDGSEIYFEALKHDGFVGPKPISSVRKYVAENTARKLVLEYTPLNEDISNRKLIECKKLVGTVGYYSFQLALMGLSERYHFPVPRSPSRVVCSEAVSRIVFPEIDLRDSRRTRHDMVNPNSAWRRWLEIKCGYGYINKATKAKGE